MLGKTPFARVAFNEQLMLRVIKKQVDLKLKLYLLNRVFVYMVC